MYLATQHISGYELWLVYQQPLIVQDTQLAFNNSLKYIPFPMRRSKRNRSLSIASESRKRSRKSTAQEIILIDDADDEDDLAAILAQIKQQEESERLAKELQGSWNDASGSKNPILIDEDDEALAKRLAREWADEDEEMEISAIQPTPSSSYTASIPLQPSFEIDRPRKVPDHAKSPDKSLSAFRHLFTATRACSKCGKDVPSPRGHVRQMISRTRSSDRFFNR